jgi:DNA-directed RNA polymerase subunit RPC12/RpoP
VSLIQCRDCEARISDAAAQCIHCGRPMAGVVTTSESKPPASYEAPAKSTIRCPECGASDFRKLSVIYEDGVSVVETATSGVGISLSGSVGLGRAKTTGTHRTLLAERAAPPDKMPLSGWTGLVVLVGFMFVASGQAIGFGLLLGLPALGWLFYARYYNTKIWSPLYTEWQRRYMCDRCGSVFMPE